MLDSHLEFFPPNLGAVNDKQSERIYKDICLMEKRYQGKWSAGMVADYCCKLKKPTRGQIFTKIITIFAILSNKILKWSCCLYFLRKYMFWCHKKTWRGRFFSFTYYCLEFSCNKKNFINQCCYCSKKNVKSGHLIFRIRFTFMLFCCQILFKN